MIGDSELAPTRRALLLGLWLALPLAAAVSTSAETLLVANKSDHTVDLIDLATGRSRVTLATGRFPHEVAVSSDGRLAVISNYGNREEPGSSLTVVDLDAAAVARTIDLGDHTRPHGLAWVSERRLAVTAEGSAHLLVVDVAAGEIVRAVETGQRVSHMVAVAGGRAFVANIGSGSVTVIDLEGGEKLADIATGEGAEGIALRPGTREVWVGNRAADTLAIIDSQSLEIVGRVPCAGFPIRVAFTPDGSRALVSAARSGELVAFDAAARSEAARAALDFETVPEAASRLFGDRFGESPVPVGLAVSADGSRFWVAATQADIVAVVDSATLEVKDLLRAGREPDGMALAP